MAKETRKELLNAPDEFVSTMNKISGWMKEHIKTFVFTTAIVLGIITVSLGLYSWRTHRQRQAYLIYFDNSSDINELSMKYSDTTAGKLATLMLASRAYSKGDLENADKLARKFINEWSDKDVFHWQAVLTLACAQSDQKQWKDALLLLDGCIASAPGSIRDQALLYKGFILKDSGKYFEAKDAFKEISGEYKTLAQVCIGDMPFIERKAKDAK